MSTAAQPTGINGMWIDYDGRRWVSAGWAVELDRGFTVVGHYRDAPVYRHGSDTSTIYVPSSDSLLVPYKPRGR
jgi:hypothetical protein